MTKTYTAAVEIKVNHIVDTHEIDDDLFAVRYRVESEPVKKTGSNGLNVRPKTSDIKTEEQFLMTADQLAKFLKGRSKNSISHPAKPPKEGHTTIYAGTPEAIENVRKLGSNYILESLPHGLDHLPKASKVLRTDYFDFFTETGAGREALFGFRNNDHSLRDLNGGRYAAALYFRGYGTWMGITAWQYDLQAALDHIKATPGYALFINKPGHYRHQIMIEGDDLNNITLQEALVASSWSDTNVQSLCPLYIPTKEECLQLTKAEDNISEYFELPKEMFALDIGGLRAAGALKVKGFYDTIGRDEDCDEEDDYDDGFNGGHYR